MAIDHDKLTEFLNKFVGDLGATMAAGNVLVCCSQPTEGVTLDL